jgi:hydrogenase maturation protease
MSGGIDRIICIGNRLQPRDEAGPRVYDALAARALPAGVELVDGGLAGLDLLRLAEGCRRLVFVDALDDPGTEPGVYRLDPREVARQADATFDHASGLGYLLRMIPLVCRSQPAEIALLGVQGEPIPEIVDRAAGAALDLIASADRRRGEVTRQP